MSNGLKWQFEEATMYTNERADELEKAILETGTVKDSEMGMVNSFCIVLVHTRGVDFDVQRVQSLHLKALPKFLSTWQGLTPAQVWEYRRKYVSHRLWNQWANDFTGEGSLFMTDPAELPENMLTDPQKAELAQSDSPLA